MTWKTNNNTHKNPGRDRASSAAYNFVELPEKVVSAVEKAEDLPNQDTYSNENYPNTGHFAVTLTTKSPLYVRCPLTPAQYEKKAEQEAQGEKNYKKKLSNKPEFFYTADETKPVIPGSSLRGMLRNLLEIVSYGKVEIVKDSPKIFYRGVATTDSIGRFYKEKIKDLKTGYLKKENDQWFVQPAVEPQTQWGNFETKPYLPVKDKFVQGRVTGFLHFEHQNYKPNTYEISFDGIGRHFTDSKGKKRREVDITQISDRSSSYKYKGLLICSGSMLENAPVGSKTDRKKHAIILEEDSSQSKIKINSQAVKDYMDSLTDFMEDNFDKKFGYLKDGNPVFYIEENGEVIAFGHTPNFRLPALSPNENKAVTPLDFVPPEVRETEQIDFAGAMFGREKSKAFASRVFVTDAKYQENKNGIFEEIITPPILASPKPTAFQHYLVQTNENYLKHYGDETPDETVIRGQKLYWHRGKIDGNALKAQPNTPNVDADGIVDEKSTQHTQFRPVKSEVSFEFKVYFENLSNKELGALCWILEPQGNSEFYYHKLGMGKAFGMGAVELKADLYLDNRQTRYRTLFENNGEWKKGESVADEAKWKCFLDVFEKKILFCLQSEKAALSEVERIKMLLAMLEWKDKPENMSFKETTDFEARDNNFKQRRVLPNPLYPDENFPTHNIAQSETNLGRDKKIGTVRVLGSLPKAKG